jgi:hypothetical protein
VEIEECFLRDILFHPVLKSIALERKLLPFSYCCVLSTVTTLAKQFKFHHILSDFVINNVTSVSSFTRSDYLINLEHNIF